MQFHRPDLDEGLILVIPPLQSPQRALEARLQGLDPQRTYELDWQIAGQKSEAPSAALMRQIKLVVPPGDGGERLVSRRLRN